MAARMTRFQSVFMQIACACQSWRGPISAQAMRAAFAVFSMLFTVSILY